MGCFKTYDIRGRLPDELNADIAARIGASFARVTGARSVVVGRDMRLSSPEICQAVVDGLSSEGVRVLDLGLCGTEIVYFATNHYDLDGGIMVTASHNPADYNGMKLVGRKAAPLSQADLGLLQKEFARLDEVFPAGKAEKVEVWSTYLDFLESIVAPPELGKMKVVCDGGNGAVGPLLTKLARRYPQLNLILENGEPDGNFPNGVPNPLLPERRTHTSQAVLKHGAALGVAWDGDYDRCFFFDEAGRFVETYYLIGTIAETFLRKNSGETILYDPRLTWATLEQVQAAGGQPRLCRTGHVFFKQMMADSGAIYGAEMSGHHYFRDFGNCDSGILPFLLTVRLLQAKGVSLSDLVAVAQRAHPISGELNFSVRDPDSVLERVRGELKPTAIVEERIDGLSLEFDDWRFNLRASNTEPLLRLNVEATDSEVLSRMTSRLVALIEAS